MRITPRTCKVTHISRKRSHSTGSLILSRDHITLFESCNPLEARGKVEGKTRSRMEQRRVSLWRAPSWDWGYSSWEIRGVPSFGTSVTSNLLPVDIYSHFENEANLKYLEILTRNQNPICEEITIKLNLGNACCNSVQNFLPSRKLSKYVKNCGFVQMWNIVSQIKWITHTEGVWEQGAEENICT
jgi:hypothetical protein